MQIASRPPTQSKVPEYLEWLEQCLVTPLYVYAAVMSNTLSIVRLVHGGNQMKFIAQTVPLKPIT